MAKVVNRVTVIEANEQTAPVSDARNSRIRVEVTDGESIMTGDEYTRGGIERLFWG